MEIRKINIFFPIFIAAYIVLSIIAGNVMLALSDAGIMVPDWIRYVISEGVLLVIVIIYMAVNRIDPLKDIPYKRIGLVDVILSLVAGYCMIPMVLFLSNLTMLFSTNYLEAGATTLLTYPFVMQVILLAVIPPIVEELVFRGIFFGSYRKAGMYGAAVMSGLVFGCFHLNINQGLYAFAIGVVFAYMVEASGSLWSSVIAHFAINTYSIGVIQLLKMAGLYTADGQLAGTLEEGSGSVADTGIFTSVIQMAVFAAIAAVFMLLTVLCIKAMAKRNARLENIKVKPEGINGAKKYLSLPVVLGMAVCVCYMIRLELIS